MTFCPGNGEALAVDDELVQISSSNLPKRFSYSASLSSFLFVIFEVGGRRREKSNATSSISWGNSNSRLTGI